MDRRFSNATSSLASASLRLRTEQLLADGAGRSGESLSPRAALYARPWPEVAPGPGPPARYAIRARKDGKRVKFYSRPGNDLTWRFSRSSLKRCPDSGRAPASLTEKCGLTIMYWPFDEPWFACPASAHAGPRQDPHLARDHGSKA